MFKDQKGSKESKTDKEEKKLLNKIFIFIFFAHKCILGAS